MVSGCVFDLPCFHEDRTPPMGLQCGQAEVARGFDRSSGCGSFMLRNLFAYDDFERYKKMVFDSYSSELYEQASPRPRRALKQFDDLHSFKPRCMSFELCQKRWFSWHADPVCDVRAVSEDFDIVLDSGSDATVIPIALAKAAKVSASQVSVLRDAQGAQIATTGVRDISIVLQSTDGRTITFKDRGHVSNKVQQPLLSFGKLLRNGWSILADPIGPMLGHESGAKIPISFKNHSVMIHGEVRMVEENVVHEDITEPTQRSPGLDAPCGNPLLSHSQSASVRAIAVDIPASWGRLKAGWYDTAGNEGFPMCVSSGVRFVDPITHVIVSDYPFRTTLGYRDGVREIVELCERIITMNDRSSVISPRYQGLITLVSKSVLIPEEVGLSVQDVSMHESGSASSNPQDRQLVTSSLAKRDSISTNVSGKQMEGKPVGRPLNSAPLAIPESVAVQPTRDNVMVGGVSISKTSAISVLRAACQFLQVSQSGSKAKLWDRVLATLDKNAILAEKQLVDAALRETKRDAISVHTTTPPGDEEIAQHNINHFPYAPWCVACNMAKARPDPHKTDHTSVQQRELPVISFDFFYSGKSGEAVSGEDAAIERLTCLAVHDSFSGAVHCIPTSSKGNVHFLAQEILRFIQFLGYGDVTLRTDQEPVALNVQELVRNSRQQQNLKTLVENSKPKDSGSNAAVEKAIDVIRNQAMVFVFSLIQNIGFDISCKHPLFAWAFVHAAWTLTWYNVKGNTTAYEIVTGHGYHGKLVAYGSPVMVHVGDTRKQKGEAKWKPGIFLSKSLNNDMFVTSVDGNLKLSRALKNIFPVWHERMDQYRQVSVFPWQIGASFGNRIDAGPRSRNPTSVIPVSFAGIDDEAASDPGDFDDGIELMEESVAIPPLTPLLSTTSQHATASGPTTPQVIPVTGAEAPPPHNAAVSEPVESSHPSQRPRMTNPIVAVRGELKMQRPTAMGVEQAGHTRSAEDNPSGEPSSKRHKAVLRVNNVEMHHMDVDPAEYFEQKSAWSFDEASQNMEKIDFEGSWNAESSRHERVWQPFSNSEPVLSEAEMEEIDGHCG